ncbi:MAG: flippase [Anaerocolumna sp.]|jgi:O-antigen/teichoic acid export membrane protein|nr:flippase [Anaerocolumna sp.]
MRTIKNLLYNTIYQLFAILIPLITSPYISRILGAENLGTYLYTQTIAGYFGLFATLGIFNYGSRYISGVRNSDIEINRIFKEIVALQIFLSLILAINYIIFIVLISSNKMLLSIQLLYYLSIALDISWFYIGKEEFKAIIIRNIFIKIIIIICIFLFVHKKEDLLIYTLIMSLGSFSGQLILWINLKEKFKIKNINKKNIMHHLKSSLLLFIPIISINIYKLFDKLMLGYTLSNKYVAYYSNAEKFGTIAVGFIIAVNNVIFPKISYLIYNKQEKKANIILYFSIRIITILSIAMTFALAGCSIELAPVFYGNEFIVSGSLMHFLSPIIIMISINHTLTQLYFIPNNKEKIYSCFEVIGSIVNIILNFVLIPRIHVYGALISILFTEFLIMTMMTIVVNKEISFINIYIKTIPYIMTGILMYLSMRLIGGNYGISIKTIILQIIAGGIVFLVGTLVILFFIDKELKKFINDFLIMMNERRKLQKYVTSN